MSKKEKLIDIKKLDDDMQTASPINSIIVTALDPIYTDHGQLSYGFTVSLDGTNYSFRTNQQGYLQLNGSGEFNQIYVLGE